MREITGDYHASQHLALLAGVGTWMAVITGVPVGYRGTDYYLSLPSLVPVVTVTLEVPRAAPAATVIVAVS